jgi:hypothetical protein
MPPSGPIIPTWPSAECSTARWEEHTRLEPSADFPEPEHATFPHSRRRTAESLAATLGTHSHVRLNDVLTAQ